MNIPSLLFNKKYIPTPKSQDQRNKFFHNPKYQIGKIIGYGAYSCVALCTNRQTGQKVAIKRIQNLFRNDLFALRNLRELIFLKNIDHQNVIKLLDAYSDNQLNQVYFVLQYQPKDLGKLYKSNYFFQHQHIEMIVYKIIGVLLYLQSAKIIHRDLKPQNILINQQDIKISDFGLSRNYNIQHIFHQNINRIKNDKSNFKNKKKQIKKQELIKLTPHIATRWYRAPEVILLEEVYDNKVDMWAVGCIYADLLMMVKQNQPFPIKRKPLFPGAGCYPLSPPSQPQIVYKQKQGFPHSVSDQLYIYFTRNKILNVLGTPQNIDWLQKQEAKKYIQSFDVKKGTGFKNLFASIPVEGIDFLKKVLVINPKQRLSINQALQHPLFAKIRDKNLQVTRQPLNLDISGLTTNQIISRFQIQLKAFK